MENQQNKKKQKNKQKKATRNVSITKKINPLSEIEVLSYSFGKQKIFIQTKSLLLVFSYFIFSSMLKIAIEFISVLKITVFFSFDKCPSSG